MIIDPNNRLPASSSNSARNKPAGVDSQTGQKQSDSVEKVDTGRDSVQLSPEAQALKRLEAQINASPDIDIGRVAAIKRAIAEGNFEINVERIAERMLQQDNLLG
jgi:negative regulator of flagellin synthesis FlgM